MAKATKAAPKKAAPAHTPAAEKKAAAPRAHKTRAFDEDAKPTLDDIIAGAKETIALQMEQPAFGKLSYNDHAKAARGSLMQTVLMGHIDTDLNGKALHNYLTAALDINDKK